MLRKSFNACRVASATLALSVFFVALASMWWALVGRFSHPVFPFHLVPDHACDGQDGISSTFQQQKQEIPNIVHYVWLLKDSVELDLDFKMFISIYSAYIFWKPEKIFLHTDASPEIYGRAKNSGTTWTMRSLAIPGVTPNYVKAPATTAKGIKIKLMPHKADFIRLEALQNWGGVYLDTDAIPLRSIDDLRKSGFANIVGGETVLTMSLTGYLNNGVMMSQPHSTLMTIFYHAAHEFFDGGWTTASIQLLTDLANHLAAVPSEVLILPPQAFAPTSWERTDVKRLFLPKLDSLSIYDESYTIPPLKTCGDALAWLGHKDRKADTWELDFSSSYILHAFDAGIESMRGWDGRIDLKYVLDRRSNYARTVFPAVWHAVKAGVIPKNEIH